MTAQNKYKVLIVQSKHQKFLDVQEYFKNQFAKVLVVPGVQAFEVLEEFIPDLIVADYSVSDMSGILFFKKLMASPGFCLIPTIFISDSRSYDHRLNAFEIGAADFIHRPLNLEALLQKSMVHIRNRRKINKDQSVQMANLLLIPAQQGVLIDDEPVSLTELEYKILHCLLTNPRQIISRSEIYETVWGKDMTSTGRLDTQLYNLKRKIHRFHGKIKSVNKIGMRILAEESIFFQEPKKTARRSRLQEPLP
jgi:DNA-binding response OmpR family regulator